MDTAPNPDQTDARQVLSARADEELAHAYEQIARVGEEMARAEKQLSKLERDAAGPAVRRKRSLFDRPAVRGLTGLLLAACIGAYAIARQSSSGDAANEMTARLTPQRVATSSTPLENPERAAEPSLAAVPAAAAKTEVPQPGPAAPITPDDIALTAAALSPAMTQLLQSMARDLANLGQGIEQLKASQEQMAHDNASAALQLKAGQEDIARLLAKASDARASDARASVQSPRPRTSAPPPIRPAATPARKPVRPL
jgi:hypothetical protein